MSPFQLWALTAVLLVALGIHALIAYRNFVRKIIALNVLGGGVFLFLVAVAHRNRGAAPDPVPHAMVLTGIVVAVSATALALALARRIHERTGRVSLSEAEGLE